METGSTRVVTEHQRPGHPSGTYSCPARKLPILRGHFHLLPFFDEEGYSDFQARLQSGSFGSPARRVAPNRRLRVSNVQLNEYRQLQTDRIAVKFSQLNQRAFNQEVQCISDHLTVESDGLVALLVQKMRTIPIAVQIGSLY